MTGYKNHRFHVLDGMRGIAAITVMIYHYYLSHYWPWLKNPFLAVDFFFMLSGFVIWHAYADKLKNGMSAADFLARRIARLYPLFCIGLLIATPFLWIKALNGPGTYMPRDMIATVISNLFMVPYVSTRTFVVDGETQNIQIFPANNPLWSISLEMLASASFLLLVKLRRPALTRFCLASLVVFAAVALTHGFSQGNRLIDVNIGFDVDNLFGGLPRLFFGFSAGILIYLVREQKISTQEDRRWPRINPWLLYLALVVMLVFPSFVQGFYDVFAITVVTPLLLWLGSLTVCKGAVTTKVSEFLGWISFPVYCLHTPMFSVAKALTTHFAFLAGHVPKEWTAIICTLFASVVITSLLDRLSVQRGLTGFLRKKLDLLFYGRQADDARPTKTFLS